MSVPLIRGVRGGRCSDTPVLIPSISLQKDEQHADHVAAVRRGLQIPKVDLEELQAEIEEKYQGELSFPQIILTKSEGSHSSSATARDCFT